MSAQLTVKKSGIYGKGCFALAHFTARKKIATYAGELVKGSRKIEARLRRQQEVAIKIIRIDENTAVDGAVGGNETAYINHSCDPNAFMRVVPGQKVAIFARRDIRPGEELTINYRDPYHPEVCKCGAANCRSKRRRRGQ
ncbi:MAG: SET domain-containing protein-lysine N-methyltransferase [Acidobacteria bacterium]|nr:SET domain-containing protein-lysine N-methyltransferase [Acidobacteriota bacterium]MCA1618417.1 SET domain-containing protein-lysine N-methyltransferase [Acidobacteriota bacterium]